LLEEDVMTKGDWQYLAVGVVTIPAIGWIGRTYAGVDNWGWSGVALAVWFFGAFIRKPVGWFLHLLFTNPKEALRRTILLGVLVGALTFVGLVLQGEVEINIFKEWTCIERGNTMLSISENGDIGPAEKACTCTGMADFERRKFGRVDYAALNKDHGCNFD
jgi:hypothetical protein